MTFTEDQIDAFPVGTQINYSITDGQTGTVIKSGRDGGASSGSFQIAGGRFWRQIATWKGATFDVAYIPGVNAKPTPEQIDAVVRSRV